MLILLIVQFGRRRRFVTRVVILGSSGLIGHRVYLRLKGAQGLDVFGFGHKNSFAGQLGLLDVHDMLAVERVLTSLNPDYIVNCVGSLISESQQNPARACFLNAFLPNFLAALATRFGGRLIHISTDCVFSGESQEGYTESDIPDGTGIYSRSKALGEIFKEPHCTLRTSVVGPELGVRTEELFNWFMFQRGQIEGYEQAIWSGVTTIELAKAVFVAIRDGITGLHHVSADEPISKYELLQLFKKYSGKQLGIKKVAGVKTNKRLINTKKLLRIDIPDYESMVMEMFVTVREMRSGYYGHYERFGPFS
jgi:dTDP-4-dehydrorhamnose reductase